IGETLVWLDAEGQLQTLSWKECERFLLNKTQPVPSRLSTTESPISDFVIRGGDADDHVVLAAGSQGEVNIYSLANQQPGMRFDAMRRGPVHSFAATGSGRHRVILSGGEEGQLTIQHAGQ